MLPKPQMDRYISFLFIPFVNLFSSMVWVGMVLFTVVFRFFFSENLSLVLLQFVVYLYFFCFCVSWPLFFFSSLFWWATWMLWLVKCNKFDIKQCVQHVMNLEDDNVTVQRKPNVKLFLLLFFLSFFGTADSLRMPESIWRTRNTDGHTQMERMKERQKKKLTKKNNRKIICIVYS